MAAVTIAALSGDNGILRNAAKAKVETAEAEQEEQTKLGEMEDTINEYVTGITVEQVTDENPGALEGTGTDADPYIINSIEDLVVFSYNVREGNTYEGQTVKLGTSLDFNSNKSYIEPFRTDYGEYGYNGELKTLLTTGEGFKPIGTIYDANISTNYFCGTFDGNYNVIYNLYQIYEDPDNTLILGLFGTNAGSIKNLIIENSNINGSTNNMNLLVGVVCGRNRGNITNCGSSGIVKVMHNGEKSVYVAGITGQAMGTIERCFSKTNIETSLNKTSTSTTSVGGIAGALTESYIKSCYNMATITINLNADLEISIGGISGSNSKNKKIENCYNAGNINLKATSQTTKKIQVGSIVGTTSDAEMNYCFNIGQINIDLLNDNDTTYIGNITGDSWRGIIGNCYNIGNINVENIEIQKIGQIAGRLATSNLSNCSGIIEENINLIGYEYGSTKDKVTLIEKNEIPNILQVIGQEFENDSNNINQGNPILNWELNG